MELMRRDLKLIVIKSLESSEGSAHVPVNLSIDGTDNYEFYTTQIHIRYIYKNKVYEEMLPMDDEGFYIPSKPLFESGPIELAVHLIRGEKKFVTNEVCLVVQRAPNGNSQIGPSELSWQQLVDQYVESKLNVIMARIDNMIQSMIEMLLNNNFSTNLMVDFDNYVVDENGDNVLADWAYMVKS